MYTRMQTALLAAFVFLFVASLSFAGQRHEPGAMPNPVPLPASAVSIDEKKAGEIALGMADGGKVVSTELHYGKDGRPRYAVLLVDKDSRIKVAVDATDGRILKFDRKDIETVKYPKKHHGWAGVPDTAITAERAREIALERTGGGMVVKIERDYEKGGLIVYEVDVIDADRKYELEVDARTGDIIEYKEKMPKHLRDAYKRGPDA